MANTIPPDYFIKECPHCQTPVVLYRSEINCRIYRHGVFKSTLMQIDPHATEEQCRRYIEQNLIYGCGKPFRIEFIDDATIILCICDYI
jgi:hypothetical protein